MRRRQEYPIKTLRQEVTGVDCKEKISVKNENIIRVPELWLIIYIKQESSILMEKKEL